jgi:hypothetical protein
LMTFEPCGRSRCVGFKYPTPRRPKKNTTIMS